MAGRKKKSQESLEGKVKTKVEVECIIYRRDGTIKDYETAQKEYITSMQEVN